MKLAVLRVAGKAFAFGLCCFLSRSASADSYVYLTEVPDYTWYAGCFGTATGNLMGFWDRHGFPDFYTGPTAEGVAPMNSDGENVGIRSMWASKAGFDGRPASQPGHIDDYWLYYRSDGDFSYESTILDPYVTAGRIEHTPDCIGDFIGLSQRKWTNSLSPQNGECVGNIDAYSFVYWDNTGRRRTNFTPTASSGPPPRDIQSGLREWTRYRGYDAGVFTQLTDFNTHKTTTNGFTYKDLKKEIDSGFPVLLFLQPPNQFSHTFGTMMNANPYIHGMLVYGYIEAAGSGVNKGAIVRTSWGSGDNQIYEWGPVSWLDDNGFPLHIRGVIGFHPKPRIRSLTRSDRNITIIWDGPSSQIHDEMRNTTTSVHRYQLEKSSTLDASAFSPVGAETTDRTITVPDSDNDTVFYRLKLIEP
jgi:hypothetical protein